MGAVLFFGGCSLPSPSAAIRPPEVAGQVDETAKAVQDLLAPGQTVVEARLLGASDGDDGGQKAVVVEDLNGDGQQELVVGYRDPEEGNGVFIAHRTPQGWQKVWQEILGPPELDILGVEDLTGDGQPEVIIGGIIGASAGNHLKVLSYALSEKDGTPSYTTLWQAGYHLLEVGDFDQDDRQEIALWVKDTGTAMAVEVYRWSPAELHFPAGFYEAEDAYPAYFPRVIEYYRQHLQEMPDAAFLWYYLASAQVKAGRPEEALASIEKGMGLKGDYPSAEQWDLVKGQALVALGRYEEALTTFTRITTKDKSGGSTSESSSYGVAPFLLAQAYYGTGLAWEGLKEYDRARGAYTRAVELQSDWIPPARALQRLNARPAVDKVTAYLAALKPEERERGLKGIEQWAREQGLYLATVKAQSAGGLPETWLVDLKAGPYDGTIDVHLIYWWEEGPSAPGNGRLKYQAFYSAEAQVHGLGPTHQALSGRLALGPEDSAEMAAVYDSAFSGSGSPRPELYLLRRQDDGWRILWRPPSREWRNSHGSITFTGAGLEEFILQSDSWEAGDGKDQIFHEANAGPHRQFRDVWRRQGGNYQRVAAETVSTAYSALVEFIYHLSLGQEEQAAQWALAPGLTSQAKEWGLIQQPLGQRWLLELPDPAAELQGPLTIASGPAAGIQVTFANREGKWLLKELKKVRVTDR
ncbi:tetratricopeptide repeat protein [Thermanaeromonas sp. C210]|uniref:tetratricopeptide repeat protein n=1 Tax=Thermanaeromonas sp. C210 TaxID=2731925 RepID=UPI0015657F3F|nr:tetratricopeptide repeat protein [Thermanaeromonas sp. C210]